MEENNNNNGNKIVEQGKQMAKNAVKNTVKKPIKQILKLALPYIGAFFLILIVVGVLNAVTYYITSWFRSIFNPTDATSTNGDEQIKSSIAISDDGTYEVDVNFADDVVQKLEDKGVNTEELGLIQEKIEEETTNGNEGNTENTNSEDSLEDAENLIEKYIEAHFMTMLPKTGQTGNDMDGNVVIKRQFADGSGLQNLTYKKYKDFMDMINSQNGNVLKYFSINPENFNLLIAEQRSNVEHYYDREGKIIDSKTESSKITLAGDDKEGIDYLTLIQNYGAPFNFFLSLHMVALDAEFMEDLVDMVLNENSPIELTYVDNSATETKTYEYTGTSTEKTREVMFDRATPNSIWHEASTTVKNGDVVNITKDNVNEYKEKYPNMPLNEYSKIETTVSSGRLYITKADTWLKQTERKLEDRSGSSEEITEPEEDEKPYSEKTKETRLEDEIVNEITKIERYSYSELENFFEKEKKTSTVTAFTVVDVEDKVKIQEFVDFINEYPGVVNNFKSSPSQIIYWLEKDESTQTLSKVMRYVLFRLTGVDYGVTSEDDIIRLLKDPESFTMIKGDSAENFIKAWENDALWAYETGQTENIPTKYLTQDGLNYIVYEDGSGGHNNIAYGIATFLSNRNTPSTHPDYGNHSPYGPGYYNWKDEFATQEIDVKTLYEGALVDKEKTTEVFQCEILPHFKNKVEDYLETNLPEYEFSHEQKDALISICYKYGNISGFDEAYEKSLNEDGTINAEALKENYSRFNYSSEFNDRKYANWLLFTEGAYVDRLGNEIPMGGRLVEAAYRVGDYFNELGYDVHYAGNSVKEANNNGRICIWNNIKNAFEMPVKQPEKYGVVCATFVSFALWQSGLIDEETMNEYNYNYTYGVGDILTKSKYKDEWIEITNWSELQEGDIVHEDGHIYIYMDGDKKLDQTYCIVKADGDGSLRGTLRNAKMAGFIIGYRYVGKK